MEHAKSFFIKIDEFIFQKLDLLRAEGMFQKGQDLLSNLEEAQQKTVAQVAAFFFLLFPFFIVLFLWWGNSQAKKGIETKKQIIEQIALYDGNRTTLNNVSGNYLSSSAINGQEDMDNKVRNIASSFTIDQQKITIQNFNQTSSSATIAKAEADISFTGFGTTDFSNFMRGLVENEKFKIQKVNLTKNTATQLLEGSISVLHMGQNPLPAEGNE